MSYLLEFLLPGTLGSKAEMKHDPKGSSESEKSSTMPESDSVRSVDFTKEDKVQTSGEEINKRNPRFMELLDEIQGKETGMN